MSLCRSWNRKTCDFCMCTLRSGTPLCPSSNKGARGVVLYVRVCNETACLCADLRRGAQRVVSRQRRGARGGETAVSTDETLMVSPHSTLEPTRINAHHVWHAHTRVCTCLFPTTAHAYDNMLLSLCQIGCLPFA